MSTKIYLGKEKLFMFNFQQFLTGSFYQTFSKSMGKYYLWGEYYSRD